LLFELDENPQESIVETRDRISIFFRKREMPDALGPASQQQEGE
jgi:hypothetical protein